MKTDVIQDSVRLLDHMANEHAQRYFIHTRPAGPVDLE